jgi:flagellar biosynthesis protein FlhG
MTISSGLAGVGKTHLAVNLALEMARRGRRAAVFNQTSSRSSIDELLDLPQTALLQRRSTDHGDSLVCRGYQGIDILSSGVALSQWDSAPEPAVKKIIADMDVKGGYDDFLVDTSGMDPRTQLACCRASSLVILVVTPDSRSLPETFALLRILQLNGFEGESCLLVNRVSQPVDADELYLEFNTKLDDCLGLDVPLLGMLANDVHVQRAQRTRQAFSSLFPNAEVSGHIVVIADAIDAAIPRATADRGDLTAYWDSFREILALPVALTGGAFLELPDDTDDAAVMSLQQSRESGAEVMLLQLDSSFHTFSDALDRLPGLLHATADDVSDLHCLLEEEDDPVMQESLHPAQDAPGLLHFAVSLIREVERLVVPVQKLQLQVNESLVRGDDADWLQAGCYLKYLFRFPDQEDVLLRIKSMLAENGGFQQESGQDGETVWETVVADHSGCMNIVHTPDDNIRIQVWLPLRKQPKAHQGSQKQVLVSSRMIH